MTHFYRFPAQEDVGGDSKIPTIVIYDKQGRFEAAGAEALDPRFEDDDDDAKWVKAEWYDFLLHTVLSLAETRYK